MAKPVYLILFITLILLQSACNTNNDFDFPKAKAEIEEAVLLEEKAFALRDYETWKKYWIQTEDLTFVSTEPGIAKKIIGWETFNTGVQGEFKREPDKNFKNKKHNIKIHVDSGMAFIKYDSFHGSTDEKDKINYYCVMMKKNNYWKYLYMHQVSVSLYESHDN